MELTASAFNVLLDMTTVSTEAGSLPSNTSKQPEAQKDLTANHSSKPTLHYSDGQSSRVVSSEELIHIICAAPQAKHLIWTKGYKTWRSWKESKSLVQAVQSHLQAAQKPSQFMTQIQSKKTQVQTQKARAQKPQVQQSKQVANRAQVKPSTASNLTQKTSTKKAQVDLSAPKQVQVKSPKTSLTAPEQARSKPPKARHSFNYLSVPATVFTRFDVELSSIESTIPFVGLDQSIESGGLFIPTDRVLNIGDYLQITVRIHEKAFLKFEAPVMWLRTKQDETNLKHGVAVAWPKLTPKQVKLIQRATSAEHYEFFVA